MSVRSRNFYQANDWKRFLHAALPVTASITELDGCEIHPRLLVCSVRSWWTDATTSRAAGRLMTASVIARRLGCVAVRASLRTPLSCAHAMSTASAESVFAAVPCFHAHSIRVAIRRLLRDTLAEYLDLRRCPNHISTRCDILRLQVSA